MSQDPPRKPRQGLSRRAAYLAHEAKKRKEAQAKQQTSALLKLLRGEKPK